MRRRRQPVFISAIAEALALIVAGAAPAGLGLPPPMPGELARATSVRRSVWLRSGEKLRALAVLLVTIGVSNAVGIQAAGAVPSGVPVLGVTPSGRLERLDPRTLVPVRGSPSLRLGARLESAALSPDGTRAALAFSQSVLVVDARTLRVVERIPSSADASRGLLWLADGLLIAHGWTAFTGPRSVFGRDYTVFGHLYTVISSSATRASADGAEAVLPEGVVLTGASPPVVEVFGSDDLTIPLTGLPSYPRLDAAADAAGDRVFAVSGSTIAEIDQTAGAAAISYHSLPKNVSAPIWVGQDRIAVADFAGLSVLDTTDWSLHPIITPSGRLVAHIVPTPYGFLAWNEDTNDGLSVYRPNGTLRFRRRNGITVWSVESTDTYAYIQAGGRFSIDLRTGRITGPLQSKARLVLPTLVQIP